MGFPWEEVTVKLVERQTARPPLTGTRARRVYLPLGSRHGEYTLQIRPSLPVKWIRLVPARTRYGPRPVISVPEAVRISLNAAPSREHLASGLQTVADALRKAAAKR